MSRRTKRQKHQLELAFGGAAEGEAPSLLAGGAEVLSAAPAPESPAAPVGPMMERIVARDNLKKALAQVRRNKGAPGVDGMTVDDLAAHLKDHWPEIRAQLLNGTYQPQPVRRVEIPKASGGTRGLGIPSVLDRFLQQAVMQVLQEDWDPTFSPSSYGFRPGRSAHQAVAAAQQFIADGCHTVVDLDLEKFFDRVNHDILMGLVAKRVQDRPLLRLIRRYLTAGVLVGGMVDPMDEGVPQGGPLSPLLSNLMLDVLDKELERRGHRFARYADDCNIYVRSQRAGERVMASVTRFLERRLKLRVNTAKSAVASPTERKFLGFSFVDQGRCQAVHCAAGARQVQAAGPRTHATDRWAQPRADRPGAIALSHRMARVLRLLRDSNGYCATGQMDQATAPRHRLEAVEVRANPLCGIAPPRHREGAGGENRR